MTLTSAQLDYGAVAFGMAMFSVLFKVISDWVLLKQCRERLDKIEKWKEEQVPKDYVTRNEFMMLQKQL